VSTVFRCLEGALGKTTDGVARRYAIPPKGRQLKAYYPVGADRQQFEELFERNLPGVAASHPQIRDAFARYQPYQPKRSGLKYLKKLYRENHHWDFTLQDIRRFPAPSIRFDISNNVMIPSITGPPAQLGPFLRIPVDDSLVDWFFDDPPVSVAHLLEGLHATCTLACQDISQVAEISS
jgi:hypothetical protein